MLVFKNFTEAYYELTHLIYGTPDYVCAPRGLTIKERLGVYFEIQQPLNRIPYVPDRDFALSYMIAELIWYLSGNDDTEWISEYSGFWKHISDHGKANSAYGRYLFVDQYGDATPEGLRTQWDYIIDELRRDPDSRRAVIHIRQPEHSFMDTKDVPCTLSLQFFIRDGNLNQIASMRSSDLIFGLAYDVPAFTFLQEMLAAELGVGVGWYRHISASLHVYERHFEMCENIMKNDPRFQSWIHTPVMPPIPSRPPVEMLDGVQWGIRHAKTENELKKVLRDVDGEQYWMDWVLILAHRRAMKLKLDDLAASYASSLSFEGYKMSLGMGK
jgi:thymidylate synthase